MADTPLQVTGREESTEPPVSPVGILVGVFKEFLYGLQDYSIMAGRALANLLTGPHYV